MKHFNLTAAGALSCLAIISILGACSSSETPDDAAAGTGPSAGSGGGAGTPSSGGKAGAAGSAGSSSGSSSGGTSGSASGGSAGAAAGTGPSGGSAGMPVAGTSGGPTAGASGSASGAGPNAGNGGAGGSTAGNAGNAGTGGSGGSGGTGVIGSAVFQVESELASDVDSNAPTTVGIVTFTVDKPSLTAAHIEFGPDTTYGTSAPVDLTLTDHRTLLLGMKPETTYHFRVVATDAAASYQSDDYSITTGAATNLVSISSFSVEDEAARQPGFIVTSYWSGTGSSVPFILDADGDIVWWAPGGPNGIARARMSADGKNMWMISASNSGAALQRVSMDGLDAQTYQNATSSHDITAVEGETMAFLEYGETDCDSIYEIDPSGMMTEVWDSQSVVSGAGCHGNAVRYSQAEDLYTFSDVSTDIFAVNRQGQVEWQLSDIVSGGNQAWGGVQHGHQLLENSILIFANRGEGAMESSAIEYSLDGGQELLNFSSDDYSANLGDVQRLPNGNTLITYSNDTIIKEIDAQQNVVLEIHGSSGTRIGYALWTPSLYDPAPDIDE